LSCTFVPARLVHCGPLAANLREMDRLECRALGRTPKDALRSGLRCSLDALTALDENGKPGAMMGVVPVSMIEGRGTAWMLGTEEIYRHGRDLLTYGPLIVEHWLQTFRVLENIIAAENVRAIRLLRHWGFTVGESGKMHGGVEFVPFHIERAAIQAQRLAA
jgi:hypothetical protein